MAIEVRRIIFQSDELKAIIKENYTPSDPSLRGGKIMMIDVNETPPLSAVAHMQCHGQQHTLRLAENDLLSCIIGYCLANRIPMSKNAKKTLNKNDKGITFDMVVQANIPI